jgi:hypothetical protein
LIFGSALEPLRGAREASNLDAMERQTVFLAAFVGGWIISACADSEGTQAQPCIDSIQCPIGFECVTNYCLPVGGDDTGSGDGDNGDGDNGDGDNGDGDNGDGDTGDGDPSDSGDGDGDSGDGDGDSGVGDPSDSGDGDGDCQPGTEGCVCDGGACAANLYCNEDYLCVEVEESCGDGQISLDEECEGNNLDGANCFNLGFQGGQLACDPNTCQYDTSECSDGSCGNGLIDNGEQCDGGNLNGFSCVDLGYSGGELACDPVTCTYDASACIVDGWDGGTG